jgi:lipopolysaccharide biosynthesis glycosyltransferase
MKDNLYEKGIYLDLDVIVNPNCGSIIRSGSSWDILAYNHAEDEGWKEEESIDHLEKYCRHIKEELPSSYTGKVYFNAGVMVIDRKCYGFSVPLEKEVAFGCQDQEVLNLAVAKKELRWAALQKKWNYGHIKEKDIPGIFNKANIVHCHLPSLAPCQLSGREQLIKKVRQEYDDWIRSKIQSKGR